VRYVHEDSSIVVTRPGECVAYRVAANANGEHERINWSFEFSLKVAEAHTLTGSGEDEPEFRFRDLALSWGLNSPREPYAVAEDFETRSKCGMGWRDVERVLMLSTIQARYSEFAPSLNELMRRIKAVLPLGWSVGYDPDTGWLSVTRDQEFMAYSEPIINPGPTRSAPAMESYWIGFRVRPFVSIARYSELKAQNEAIVRKAHPLYGTLVARGVNRSFGSFWPKTDEDKRDVALCDAMKGGASLAA
jgi:hypothetical protein